MTNADITKRAHQIREEAANKFGGEEKEYCFIMAWNMAKKEMEKKMKTKQVVKWETKEGREVVYVAELILSEELNSDGWKMTAETCKFEETITIAGETELGWWKEPVPMAKKIGAAKQYGSLAVMPENWEKICKAQEAVKAHPVWIKKQEEIEKNQRELSKLEEARRRNGYCEKCGSYCYGDCEA
jgi:hypothetical protein